MRATEFLTRNLDIPTHILGVLYSEFRTLYYWVIGSKCIRDSAVESFEYIMHEYCWVFWVNYTVVLLGLLSINIIIQLSTVGSFIPAIIFSSLHGKTTDILRGKQLIFSSPEPKAQVSFSDHNLSVVRRCCRCCRRRKLFTFSSSSPEPLGQFQPNLAQNILGWRGFKFVQMKGHAIFQGEIITK